MIKVLIVGCGGIGAEYDLAGKSAAIAPDHVLTHAGAYSNHAGFKVVGCVEPCAERRDRVAKAFGIEHAYASLTEVEAGGERFDVVSIASPTDHHALAIEFAIRHQVKVIVCEKPMSADIDVSFKLLAQAQAKNIPVVLNYFRLWDVTMGQIAQDIHRGRYGGLQGGQGGYVKGVEHNGPHMITLIAMLLGQVGLEQVRYPAKRRAHLDADFTVCLPDHDGALIDVISLDAAFYNFFELTLFFEKCVLHLEDGGRRIRLRTPVEHPTYPQFIYPEAEKSLVAQQGGALFNLVDEVFRHINQKRDFSYSAHWCLNAEKMCYDIQQKTAQLKGDNK